MSTAIVTGCGGLIGSEASEYFIGEGFDVIGVDNDMRAHFFGAEASTWERTTGLTYLDGFRLERLDIRDADGIDRLFRWAEPELVVHTAAQPSHDWAVRDPQTDFGVNAVGTLNLLEATRRYCPEATFVHCSTSKVYGDTPNRIALLEGPMRVDPARDHRYFDGIDTTMSIDQCLHSLFGASKASADLMVQEYGRYFGMPTVCFRPGCLTGGRHAGTELHGFLSYLMRATVQGLPYTIYGYDGKQVRCNVHSLDLVRAFHEFHKAPKAGAVYNIGGGRQNACSMLEAIEMCEGITGYQLGYEISPETRIGDHHWWISDNRPFQRDYPAWDQTHNLSGILRGIHDENVEQWSKREAA